MATGDLKQRAIDETRGRNGEPLSAIAFAILYLAERVGELARSR